MGDYLPKNDKEFLGWAKNLLNYAGTNAVRLGIDSERITALNSIAAIFENALAKMNDPNHGHIDTQRKNEARTVFESELRAFVQEKATHNISATDDDRRAMRTPIHDKNQTPRPVPETIPELKTALLGPGLVEFRFRDPGAKRWGKPIGVHGLELCWVILDQAPSSRDELVHSIFETKNPLKMSFDEPQRGKRLYYIARWENTSNKKGPWSDIRNIIIP